MRVEYWPPALVKLAGHRRLQGNPEGVVGDQRVRVDRVGVRRANTTDYGHKCDELVLLLEELLERPDDKVIIFSQWLRTHELIMRRLRQTRWGHVLFHGGVPSPRRAALVERFHRDATCRVFLSTDAGGVGLNLQHAASVVINMDLPWNPAALEQRIGRVHRLGQTRGVQVVNFVAPGYHRGRHALGPGVQEVVVRRCVGWRSPGGVPRRLAAQTLHGECRGCDHSSERG